MNHQLIDESGDKKYFILTPQLVWAKCRSPYDFTLWSVVKMVAEEHGECWLGTRKLAKLAMMSVAKVQESRDYLLDSGLLLGELKPVNDEGHKTWHLTIPDIWQENVEWRQKHHSIQSRVAYKTGETEQESVRTTNTKTQKRSHHEQKRSHHEQKRSPGGDKEEPLRKTIKKKDEIISLHNHFLKISNRRGPRNDIERDKRFAELEEFHQLTGEKLAESVELMTAARDKAVKERYSYASPGGLHNFAASILEQRGESVSFDFVTKLPEYKPPSEDEQLFEQFKNDLKLGMTRATYDQWIQPLELIERQNGTLRVRAGPKAIEWLENRLSNTIGDCLESIEPGLRIEYVTESEKDN